MVHIKIHYRYLKTGDENELNFYVSGRKDFDLGKILSDLMRTDEINKTPCTYSVRIREVSRWEMLKNRSL